MATSCHKTKETAGKAGGQVEARHASCSGRSFRLIYLFTAATAQVRRNVGMGGVRVWELTGDDEKEETEMDGRQEDVTYSNKRPRGVTGGLRMGSVW